MSEIQSGEEQEYITPGEILGIVSDKVLLGVDKAIGRAEKAYGIGLRIGAAIAIGTGILRPLGGAGMAIGDILVRDGQSRIDK